MDILEPRGTIQNLPDELLLEIFQYMSIEELVLCIANVSIRWKNVANTFKLWKNLVYNPATTVSDDEIISMLKRMPLLRIFKFKTNCSKVDEIIDVLCSNCKFLRMLSCDSIVITTSRLLKIHTHLPNLECFQLSQWQMMDDSHLYVLSKLQKLKKLTCVNVGPSSTYVYPNKNVFQSLEHIEMVAYCTGDLIIHDGQVGPAWDPNHFLHLVPHFKNLKHLSIDFRMLHFSGFESVFWNIKNLSKLEKLSLKSLFHCNKDILTKMFKSCTFKKLWKLDLRNCLNVNMKTVQAIKDSCPFVQELHFARCIYFDDDCVKVLVDFPELTCLNLSCCNSVSEHGLAYLAQCSKLESLDLSWRPVIPHQTLPVLSTLPHLRALLLNHTQIRHDDVVEFLTNSNLRYLGLYCCNGVDGSVIQAIVPRCKICHNFMQEVMCPNPKVK